MVPPHKKRNMFVRSQLKIGTEQDEQKINLKLWFKLGKKAKETYAMLVRVYEDKALSIKFVYEWFATFREGRQSVSDNPRSRRLATSVSDENIERK
ncbi:hypothetical protein TNCV_1479271 [Trichonephila clavipes]|nr:hypothetical protein TNCV_1479271 [Trichonephila clavipes]